jgi:hypothetical protein
MTERLEARVSGAQDLMDAAEWLEARMEEAAVEHGGCRVELIVEPLETPEMGDRVRTPDGEGVVRFPTTEPDDVIVTMDSDGRDRSYDVADLEALG